MKRNFVNTVIILLTVATYKYVPSDGTTFMLKTATLSY